MYAKPGCWTSTTWFHWFTQMGVHCSQPSFESKGCLCQPSCCTISDHVYVSWLPRNFYGLILAGAQRHDEPKTSDSYCTSVICCLNTEKRHFMVQHDINCAWKWCWFCKALAASTLQTSNSTYTPNILICAARHHVIAVRHGRFWPLYSSQSNQVWWFQVLSNNGSHGCSLSISWIAWQSAIGTHECECHVHGEHYLKRALMLFLIHKL